MRSQAKLLEAAGTGLPPVVPVERGDALPLSFGQERLWFLDRLTPGSTEFTVPLFIRLGERADLDAVHAALRALAGRHEILRTRYPVIGDQPRQVVGEAGVELREAATTDLAAEATAELGRGFDLADGPVWRALLVRSDGAGDTVLLTLHHIACDGWSAVTLERDFRALYAGAESPVPALQYADHAVWQRTHLGDDLLAPGLAAWRTALEGVEPLHLPTDRPRPALRDGRGAVVTFAVPGDVARPCSCERHGTPPGPGTGRGARSG
ncbi:hypothetical protein AVL59_28600 [Streptomyces griseochromogenes]|uniref:Condensation domain-containing protein n=1 Tax=Streptomyces griseochromogenes TaxID=68214 RepID=A0A1B1B2C9_9ACTN|nr:hypothetical protein AVL59_28600 [Streptomyces griseochromogenes]